MIGNTLGDIIVKTGKEVSETEHHIHNREKWFGLAGTPSGEDHVADRMGPGIAPFQLTAGNLTWGSWVQVLGPDDTPVSTEMTKFDAHRVFIMDTTSLGAYIIQIAGGEESGLAALVEAEEFTEFPYKSPSNNADSGVSDIINVRNDLSIKAWARTCCIGVNAPTIDFYFGIHEYLL